MAEKKEVKKAEKTKDVKESKPTVDQLLSQLKQAKASKNKEEARVLRRKLRVAGHVGGLGEKGGRPESKASAPVKGAKAPAAKSTAKPVKK